MGEGEGEGEGKGWVRVRAGVGTRLAARGVGMVRGHGAWAWYVGMARGHGAWARCVGWARASVGGGESSWGRGGKLWIDSTWKTNDSPPP